LQVADRVIRQVAEGGGSLWLDREGEDGLSRVILRSFRRAVALQAAKHGARPERWRWGKERAVWFEHPLTMGGRLLRPFLNLGPYPVGGSASIVHSTGYGQMNPFQVSVAAPWRFVVDFAAPEEAQEICAPGQSGHPLSPHHQDQLPAWLKGEYLTQVYRHRTIKDLHHQVLEPAP
ncbi:MAG TPA: penicillin acylase family protein, partial [Symbiobacteriaceae bacterium]|nr:penicillin acylase family protein [Symbiobacteriaceae bacterium]